MAALKTTRGVPPSRLEPEFQVPHIAREMSERHGRGGWGCVVNHPVPQVSCHLPQSSTKFSLTMARMGPRR